MRLRKNENIKNKFMKLFEAIDNEEEQQGYEEIKNAIKDNYKKNEKYNSLERIILERERIVNDLDQLNSQFPPIAIALMAMLFTIIIPALSQYIYKVIKIYVNFNLVTDFMIEFGIQILCPFAIYIYITKSIEKKSDEFRCSRICKVVLEELEKEKLVETNNEFDDIKNDVKEVKRFLGI